MPNRVSDKSKLSSSSIIIGDVKRDDIYSAGKKTIQFISIIFLIFTSLITYQFKPDFIINWQNINFWILIIILAISKLTDYVSTLIGLRDQNCVELHPSSDLHSISKIKKAHFLEILSLAIKGFVLNLISYNYLGNAFIIIEALVGFTATLSNLTTQRYLTLLLGNTLQRYCLNIGVRAVLVCTIFFYILHLYI